MVVMFQIIHRKGLRGKNLRKIVSNLYDNRPSIYKNLKKTDKKPQKLFTKANVYVDVNDENEQQKKLYDNNYNRKYFRLPPRSCSIFMENHTVPPKLE